MTLRTRIAAAAGLSVAVVVLAAAGGLYLAVSSDLHDEVDRSLRDRAQVFARPLAAGASARERAAAAAAAQRLGGRAAGAAPPLGSAQPRGGARSAGGLFPSRVGPAPFGGATGYVQFIAPSGAVLVPRGQGSATIAVDATDRAIAASGHGSVLSDRTVRGTRLRVLTQGIAGRGAVLVARPLSEVDSELSKLLLILAIVGVAGIALAGALGALVARVALAPVRRFTERTEALTASRARKQTGTQTSTPVALDLSQRLDVEGSDELGRLADSFNGTLDALERSLEAQRQLVADAGHELRTPIASLRANVQVLGEAERLPPEDRASLRADIVSELDELTALVADVIELARGTATDRDPDEVRLDALVNAAIDTAERRSPGVSFARALEPTVVFGEPERIDRAVSNLLENARKWSAEGGVVEVGLQGGVLSVRDHGPGFDERDLPHVFDRFYRADRARKLPGSGLGLAIVRQAAEACGGYAQAHNAPDGGALLTVSFGPAQAPTAQPEGTVVRSPASRATAP